MVDIYDPTFRGPNPVGVRTEWYASSRPGRGVLTAEIWYPTTPDWSGVDVDEQRCDRYMLTPELGPRFQHAVRGAEGVQRNTPLVLFSHHSFGSRRESSHLMTHLASHGYVVAAIDHTGNTLVDRLRQSPPDANAKDVRIQIREITERRSEDVLELADHLLSGDDERGVGVVGHSWGGYTALEVTARDSRVNCVCAMTPGGSRTHLATDCLREWLVVDWDRPVPTLVFASEFDSQIPCEGVVGLYERLSEPKRLCILDNCDHVHYVDRVAAEHEGMRQMLESLPAKASDVARTLELIRPIASLRDPEEALVAVRALSLAHLDAELRSNEDARRWLGTQAHQMEAVKELLLN